MLVEGMKLADEVGRWSEAEGKPAGGRLELCKTLTVFHFLHRHAASWLFSTSSATSWGPPSWDSPSHAPTTYATCCWGWTSRSRTLTSSPVPTRWDAPSR